MTLLLRAFEQLSREPAPKADFYQLSKDGGLISFRRFGDFAVGFVRPSPNAPLTIMDVLKP